MRSLLSLLLCLFSLPALGKQRDPSQLVAKAAEEALSQGHIPGLSVAVLENGTVTLARGFGDAEVDNSVRASESTVYRINSITKAFTATAILQLAEKQKLRLDDRLSKFLPEYTRAGYDPTVYQLLNHTAGLRNYGGPSFHRNIRLDLSEKEWVDAVNDEHLYLFSPGSNWSYSNVGYDVLGILVERLSDTDLEHYLNTNVLRPAGMKDTGFCNTKGVVKNRAFSYELTKQGLAHSESWGTYGNAATRLCSTVLDLAQFFVALQSGRLISPDFLRLMRAPGELSDQRKVDYGFGTRIGHLSGRLLITYSGSGEQWTSALVNSPEDRITVIVLCNADSEDYSASRIATDILRALVGAGEETVRDLPVPHNVATKVVGIWQSFEDFGIQITESAGSHVSAQPLGTPVPPLAMRYQGDGRFVFDKGTPAEETELTFDLNDPASVQIFNRGIFSVFIVKASQH